MSKMKMPEMDVVRFNESDVIVASGDPNVFSVTGTGDREAQTASVDYMGKNYTTGAYHDLYDVMNGYNTGSAPSTSGPIISMDGGVQNIYWLNDILYNDSWYPNKDTTNVNGTYDYNGNYWIRRSN